jgi:8-amino-7-oxononanoate synthase
MVLDFTSSLYLGFRHETRSLRPWSQLTMGAPAALVRPPGSEPVAGRLARLQGCEAAALAPSTLHLFWDLFGLLAGRRVAIYLDAGTYPIARWGVERAAARGVPVHLFPHQDAGALRRLLRPGADNHRPVVVADGICTACGCAVPVADYLDSVRRAGGLLVIDDTQALGILGHSPGPEQPYGWGGGGSLRYQNISGPELLVVSSLAKGFGAPLTVLSGGREMVRQFEAGSETRVHCSPPSAAAIHAAEHALTLNAEVGDALRAQLAQRVQQFRHQLAAVGLSADGGMFPVQTLKPLPHLDVGRVHRQLLNLVVRTVLRRGCDGGGPHLSFIITARHRPDELDRAVQALAMAVSAQPHLQPDGS